MIMSTYSLVIPPSSGQLWLQLKSPEGLREDKVTNQMRIFDFSRKNKTQKTDQECSSVETTTTPVLQSPIRVTKLNSLPACCAAVRRAHTEMPMDIPLSVRLRAAGRVPA